MMLSAPAATASSTPYWMMGLSTSGSISFGCALVAGRKRVPSPAAGNTALRTLAGISISVRPGGCGAQHLRPAAPARGSPAVCVFPDLVLFICFTGKTRHGIRNRGTLHWNEGHSVRGRLPGGLHPPEEGRAELCRSGDAVYRSGRVYRLRRVRPGMSGVGHLRAG